MELQWNITDTDVAKLKSFIAAQANDSFVKYRIKRNVTNRPTSIDRADVWHGVVACLLTTQQRAGPQSHVTRFLNSNPFPLSIDVCRDCGDVATLAQRVLTDHGGIRFAPKIAKQLAGNLEWIDDKWWPQLNEVLEQLITANNPKAERAVARFIDKQLYGFGPKQSRNLLQMLGLTRYEIPLDSRVAKWFNEFGFPIKLSAGALADEAVYEFLMDGIQGLCRRADVLPCVLDGAVFASFDGDGWKELDDIIW